jgi:hypothetical protein
LSEWNQRVAEENAHDRHTPELRDVVKKKVRLMSNCRNLRAQAELDQELSADVLEERMHEPLPKYVRHRFGRDDYYGRCSGSPSTNTMTVTNSVTGAKKVVRFDFYTLPEESLAKEGESIESEDIWTQVADE